MTEKQYGGNTGRNSREKSLKASDMPNKTRQNKKPESSLNSSKDNNLEESYNDYIKAGKIASEVVKYSRTLVKKDTLLLEIAEKIESKITELGGKPAFPVNLSINEIAAHSTPAYNDEAKAHGLLKVDIGVHVNGYIADTAFSIDLENSEENRKLIEAAESALKNAVEKISCGAKLREIGELIEKSIKKYDLQPIQNLSGHSIERYELHSGITIPNIDNSQEKELSLGIYAIEPFSTSGLGAVKNSRPSGIYHLENEGNVRDSFAREILEFIAEEYKTLPFCSRWLVRKFGTKALIALKRIEEARLLHHYPQLIEKSGAKVAQAENTVILSPREKVILVERIL